MPEQEIRYIKGIDKDTAYSSYTPDKYFHLQNGKVVTVDGSSTGAIEVENGNKLLFRLPSVKAVYIITRTSRVFSSVAVTINSHTEVLTASSILELAEQIKNTPAFNCNVYTTADRFAIYGATSVPVLIANTWANIISVTLISPAQTGLKIIGMYELRDDLIVFTTNETSSYPDGYGQIWKLPINKVDGTVTGILSGDYLDDMTHLIYHGKLDFSTVYPITEIITKVDNALYGKVYFTDGYNVLRQFNAYQENLMGLSPDSFSIVPNSSLSAPDYVETLTGGMYESGIVQYTYRLYNRYGATTRFAPLSRIIYITDKNEGEQYSTDYYGVGENVATGKAIRIELRINDFSYDNIQVVSVYQETLYSTPVISVVADQLNTSPVIYITDSHRDGAEEIDYATLAALGGKEFVTQTLSVKDNFLVAMNNKELSFNPDFDARAYRFKNTGVTYVTLDMTDAAHWGVPEAADCINPYNNYSKYRAGTHDYKFKADGATPGGEGPNISFTFDTVDFTIDDLGHNRTQYVETRGGVTIGSKVYGFYGDFNFQGSVGLGSVRTWMRNEVYRYGIVFYNRGKVSPVKWIADIRIPSAYEENPFSTAGKGTGIMPVFTVNNAPLDDDGVPCRYQIVAVKREGQDMTVLANGYLDLTFKNANDSNYLNPTIAPFNWPDSAGPVHDTSVYRFICPEVNFNKNLKYMSGDVLELNCKWVTAGWDYDTLIPFGTQNEFVFKVLSTAPVAPLVSPSDRFIDLSDGLIGTAGSSRAVTIDGRTYKNYCTQVISTYGTLGASAWYAFNGTVLVLALGDVIDENMLVSGGNKRAPYAAYMRPRNNQYGGNTYADRSRNSYIVASDIQATYGIPVHAVYGDTFIEYFDYLDKMNVDDSILPPGVLTELQAYYLPVESTINLAFRYDTCYSRIGAPPENPGGGAYRLCENVAMGNAVHGTDYYAAATDLYLYNSVYSRPTDVLSLYPLPFNLPDIKEFDTEIAISEKHLNNQYTDSWCSFLPNNVTYVDGRYGAICKGVNYNNQIHFLQEGGFGLIAVNERVSTVDQTGNTLVLGTGDALGRCGYISYNTGTTEKTSVVVSGAGLHFFDVNSKKWMVYTQGSPTALSDVKGLIGYFNDFIADYQSDGHSQLKDNRFGIVAVNDNIHNRVIATLVKTTGTLDTTTEEYATISYNMFQSAFESFLDCHSPLYTTYKNDILMVNPSDLSECWYGQRGNKCTFYGVLYDTYIQLISTLRGPTMIMSTVEYDSVSTDNGVDVYDDTFNYVRFSNSYQDSGTIPVIDEENSRRLMRTWRIWAPRNNDESSVEFNPALDSDARMRDKYTKIELRYNNTNNYRFVFHPVKVSFMANNY